MEGDVTMKIRRLLRWGLVLPTGTRPVSATTQVLIAESIIVGDVPQYYISVPEGEMLNYGDVGG